MSSFRKRNVQKPIPGTRISAQTGQLITSSGNPSLDVILGGGLPIGSICLIEEDKYVTHSKVLAKYFLAEGVVSRQSIFLGSLDDEPKELMRKLPKPLNEEELEREKQEDSDNAINDVDEVAKEKDEALKNGLRIAWRYNDLPPVNSEQRPTKIGHHFNLLQPMDPMLLDYVDSVLWSDKLRHDNECEEDEDDDDGADEERDSFGNDAEAHAKSDTDTNTTSSSSGSNSSSNVMGYTRSFPTTEMDYASDAVTTADEATGTAVESITNTEQTFSVSVDVEQTPQHEEARCALPPTTPPPPPPPAMPLKPKIFENEKFLRLLKELQPFAREDKFTTGALVQRNLCRVCITSLGSPLWYDEQFPKDLIKFLTILRATVRNSVAVCMITMPMHLVAKCDATLVPKIRNLTDYAIELESFAGTERETHSAYKDYNGLLHLHKITAVNTLSAYMPETSDLAFKLRRKKFVIEKLHLPPELGEESDTTAEPIKPTLSCSSSGGGPSPAKATLDF